MTLASLAFSLLALLVITLRLTKGDLLEPSVLFCGGLTLCACMLSVFNYWNYDIRSNTVLVVLGGCAWFACVSLIASYIFRGKASNRKATNSGKQPFPEKRVPIKKAVLFAAILIQIAVIVLSALAIMNRFPSSTLAGSIDAYGTAVKFNGEKVSFGTLVDNARLACVMWGYYVCYLLAQELQKKRYLASVLPLANVVCSILIQLETGGRQGAFTYLVMVVIIFFMLRRSLRKRFHYKIDRMLVMFAAVVLLAVIFRYSAVGRNVGNFDFIEYLTIYCGAEIANLDIYIESSSWFEPTLPGSMTFGGSLSWLAKHIGFSLPDASASPSMLLPFQSINGRSLGNVYTCFYNYLVDFGPIGVLICTFIMAFVAQAIYEKACQALNSSQSCDIWVTVYAFVAMQVVMSFFANKFFSEFFTLELFKGAIFFLLIRWGYLKVDGGCNKKASLVSLSAFARSTQKFKLIV